VYEVKNFVKYIIAGFILSGMSVSAQDISYTLYVKGSQCNGANNGFAQVNATGLNPPFSYSWSTGATGNAVDGLPPGDYTVLITDATLNDTLVYISIGEAQCPISPEYAFTPNGDGYNDNWAIGNIQFYPNNKILIYNRWGQKVYEHKGEYEPWDGRDLLGIPVPDASYFYIIFGDKGDESTIKKGSVSILR
jgi:gliding motility-associated-like protein